MNTISSEYFFIIEMVNSGFEYLQMKNKYIQIIIMDYYYFNYI